MPAVLPVILSRYTTSVLLSEAKDLIYGKTKFFAVVAAQNDGSADFHTRSG